MTSESRYHLWLEDAFVEVHDLEEDIVVEEADLTDEDPTTPLSPPQIVRLIERWGYRG